MNSLQVRLQAFQKSLQDNLEKKIQNEKLQDLEQGITRAAKVVLILFLIIRISRTQTLSTSKQC